ncbi:hypothetical protein N7530_010756 [Penicillium desertorum]|uniref:Uncharacterized protein n=1 Tax=Penicillium desertorum TaxID=1303715 RepID=A0A9X0BGX2_9EURO|nr:hypothetical protein N7530_010756 [Penicillium desertorum]
MEAIDLVTREPDNQITLGARLIRIKYREITLSHMFKATELRKDPTKARLIFTKLSPILSRPEAWYRRTYPLETTLDLYLKESDACLKKLKDRTKTIRDLLTAALKLCDGLGDYPEL